MYLNINRIIKKSQVEGPGNRFVIWTQGCPIRCPDCSNKDTWDFNSGRKIKLSDIIFQIQSTKNIEGITILGGEPFSQSKGLFNLIKSIKGNNLSIILFTGYTYNYLKENGTYYQKKLLKSSDLLIDGPFIEKEKEFSRPLVGSNNQNYYFLTKKIKKEDFFKIKNKIEVRLETNGKIRINGMGDVDEIKKIMESVPISV